MKRKHLTVAAAFLAVLSFALPAQAAGPINDVVVDPGPSTRPYQDYAMTAVNASAVIATIGAVTLSCTSASGGGLFHSRLSTAGPFPRYLTLNSLAVFGCLDPLGRPITITQNCAITVSARPATQTVSAGLTDTNVTGVLDAGPIGGPCVSASGACFFDIYGQTAASFDETVKLGGVQELTIGGSGLAVRNVGGCLGMINDGDAITLSIAFDVDITQAGLGGPIDFRD
ncbi:hypothetical protein [Nocardioides sp. L-11A]|uniref:hypothetical protein n=1 Tax=Nocardioides sp. L-11A TaxID=3043848 RepID=UPI00249A7C86|nr:hypothetical protein QJ852_07730 [Nocardioides sp. L-11A]